MHVVHGTVSMMVLTMLYKEQNGHTALYSYRDNRIQCIWLSSNGSLRSVIGVSSATLCVTLLASNSTGSFIIRFRLLIYFIPRIFLAKASILSFTIGSFLSRQ